MYAVGNKNYAAEKNTYRNTHKPHTFDYNTERGAASDRVNTIPYTYKYLTNTRSKTSKT